MSFCDDREMGKRERRERKFAAEAERRRVDFLVERPITARKDFSIN